MGYKTIFLEKIWMKSSSKIERKINRHLEMMNHLTGMKIAWGNLVLAHISMLYAQRFLDGVLNHFAEIWWGYENCFLFKLGWHNLKTASCGDSKTMKTKHSQPVGLTVAPSERS